MWLTRRKIRLYEHLGSNSYTVEEILREMGHSVMEQNGLMDVLYLPKDLMFVLPVASLSGMQVRECKYNLNPVRTVT